MTALDLPFELPTLATWMEGEGLGSGEIQDARLLTGGTQNILLRFTYAGRDFVLRRPPRVPRKGNNETMLREARVLSALKGSDVPHPGMIAACADESVMGSAFYLMEPIEGISANEKLPAPHNADPAIRRRMGFALVEGAAALGRVDHVKAGLEDFGKPENYLGRQVDRWQHQLDSYKAVEDWPGPDGIPGVDRVADWLRSNLPPSFTPGILHGDYQFANVMYAPDSGELAAIIDWELCTIGDPLVDLGWVIATWRGSGGRDLPVLRVEPWDGFPTADELIEHYAKFTSRDMSHIEWYVILACYRLGIILEGTYARACAGKAPKQIGQLLHDTAVALFERAHARIDAGAGKQI